MVSPVRVPLSSQRPPDSSSDSFSESEGSTQKPKTACEQSAAMQPMSLRRLDPQSILRKLPEHAQGELKKKDGYEQLRLLIHRAVCLYNSEHPIGDGTCARIRLFPLQLSKEEQKDPERQGFRIVSYFCSVSGTTKTARWLLSRTKEKHPPDLSTQRQDFLFFLFRAQKEQQDLYAITTGDAWRVVKPYSCYEFPPSIAKRILDPNLQSLKYMGLVGNVKEIKLTHRQAVVFRRLDHPESFPTTITARLREKASLMELPCFTTSSGKISEARPAVEIEMGCVRINKGLDPLAFTSIADHYSTIFRGKATFVAGSRNRREEDQEAFSWWEDIILVAPQKQKDLDRTLLQVVWECYKEKRPIPFEFCYKHPKGYLEALEYELVRKDRKGSVSLQEWSVPKSPVEMMQLLSESVPELARSENMDQFAKALDQIFVRFKNSGRWTQAKFREYFEGEIRYKGECSYFRVLGQWYQLSYNYSRWIQQAFAELVQNTVATPEQLNLQIEWPSGQEGQFVPEAEYLSLYKEAANCLIGDKLLIDNMEFGDLILFNPQTAQLSIVQVKRGIDRSARIACSQIRHAARKLEQEFLNSKKKDSFLKRWADKYEKRAKKNGVESPFAAWGDKKAFLKSFNRNSVNFVYAFVDEVAKDRRLADEARVNMLLKKEELKDLFGEDAVGLFQEMQKLHFVDSYGNIQKMPSEEFLEALELSEEQKGQLLELFKTKTKSQFHSTIARLELLNLGADLKKKGFGFKIVQLPKASNVAGLQDAPVSPQFDELILEPAAVFLEEEDALPYNGRCYALRKTRDDGACALHACLGTFSQKAGLYELSSGAAVGRKEYGKNVAEHLSANVHEPLKQQWQKFASSMLADFLIYGRSALPNAHAIFGQEALQERLEDYKEANEQLEVQIKNAGKLLVQDFKRLLQGPHGQALFDAVREAIPVGLLTPAALADYSQLFNVFFNQYEALLGLLLHQLPIEERLKTNLQRLVKEREEALQALERLKNSFLLSSDLLKAYAKAVRDPSYWFASEEIGLIAIIYDRHITLLHAPQGQVALAEEFNRGERSSVVIFHTQRGEFLHFSRCELLPETPLNLDEDDEPPAQPLRRLKRRSQVIQSSSEDDQPPESQATRQQQKKSRVMQSDTREEEAYKAEESSSSVEKMNNGTRPISLEEDEEEFSDSQESDHIAKKSKSAVRLRQSSRTPYVVSEDDFIVEDHESEDGSYVSGDEESSSE